MVKARATIESNVKSAEEAKELLSALEVLREDYELEIKIVISCPVNFE